MYEIVILNYNNLMKLGKCIWSIRENSHYNPKITVIDNCSTDSSWEWLQLKKDLNGVKTIRTDKNMLFTIPYSEYLAKSKEKYICIMNNDIVVGKDWDKPLIDALEKDEKIGIIAPMLITPDGRIQNMGGLDDFCSHKSGSPEMYKGLEESIWTTFATVIIRMDAYNKVGGFDKQFLFYCSDSDLCIRMYLEGCKIINEPKSKVLHYHSSSTRQEQAKGNPIMQVGAEDQRKFNIKWEQHGIKVGNQSQVIRRVEL